MPPPSNLGSPASVLAPTSFRSSRVKSTHSIAMKNTNAYALATAMSGNIQLTIDEHTVCMKGADIRTFPLMESRATSITPVDEELKDVALTCAFSDIPAGNSTEAHAVATFELVSMASEARAERLSAELLAHVMAVLTAAIPDAVVVGSRAVSPVVEPTGR